jgi:hypothetical protein
MQPRPSFDRTLLIPIAIGVVSILGIGWILLTSVLSQSLIAPTAIPSSFSSLATEARTFPFWPTPTGTSPVPSPSLTETRPATSTPVTESPPPPSATPTPEGIQPLSAGKYDDTDHNIAYDQYWTVVKNRGTRNAYKRTLHVSTGIGEEAFFRFIGKGFRLGYQRGTNFGTVTVLIDDQPYGFHEQALDLVWQSPKLSRGDHFVRIIHESGESINLDYIEILP